MFLRARPRLVGGKTAKQDTEDWAEKEYATFQAQNGNLLTMGTLLFGFCATGTFLSTSFYDSHSYDDTVNFVAMVEHGVLSAMASVVALTITFVFSTRAGSQYMFHGPMAAVRTIQRGSGFLTMAEVLLYCSWYMFMLSIEDYCAINYTNPTLCPCQSSSSHIAHPESWINSSDCALLGTELFNSAERMCAPARLSGSRLYSDAQPWVACTVFDEYSFARPNTNGIWFGWNLRLNPAYEVITRSHGDVISNPKEVFLRGLKEVIESTCSSRQGLEHQNECEEVKHNSAVECHKTCEWLPSASGTGDEPVQRIIQVTLGNWLKTINKFLAMVIIGRLIAGLVTVFETYKYLLYDNWKHQKPCRTLLICDFLGIFDHCDAHNEERGSFCPGFEGLDEAETDDADMSDNLLEP